MRKRHLSHENDVRATVKVIDLFIKWIHRDPREPYSGREYGKDIIFEIVQSNQDMTGAEFCIQNKALEKPKNKLSESRIGAEDESEYS